MSELPSSPEAEAHVLAVCLIDNGVTFDRAIKAGVSSRSFLDPRNYTIFGALTRLREKGADLDLIGLFSELNGTLETNAGGGMYLQQIFNEEKIPTTLHAGRFIAELRDREMRREMIREAQLQIERAQSGEVITSHVPRVTPRAITSFPYPADSDPQILLGNEDYLGRGGGFLFVSHAGAGKSSWIMDACMMWALGKPWMGLKCNGPLRSLIIQAEDSDRYIGKIFTSFAHVNQLTPPQADQLGQNCKIVRLKGCSGEEFERELKALTAEHTPDLVIINPIYLYAQGDIGRSEFAQPFLVSLDRVNKAEKFAYILIHHTGKPASRDKSGKRAELDDWETAYMGFGSSYFANWPRASALLEPVPNAAGRYQIKLGKGGMNAGITRIVPQGVGTRQEPVTRIAIRHSTDRMPVNGQDKPVFYWELDDAPAAEDAPKPKGGKPKEFNFEAFTCIMPRTPEDAKTRATLFKYACEISTIKDSTFRTMLTDAVEQGWLCRISKPAGFYYHLPVLGTP